MTTDQKIRRGKRIKRKLEETKAVANRLIGELDGLIATSELYIEEVEENGEMSQSTCMAGATLYDSAGSDALKVLRGIYSAQEASAKLIPEGMSEGNVPPCDC